MKHGVVDEIDVMPPPRPGNAVQNRTPTMPHRHTRRITGRGAAGGRDGRGSTFLGRFGIRGKLNILLVLTLVAVLLVAAPFVAGQIDNVRSAGSTATSARTAQALGALVWELQRERLVAATYLATPTAPSADLREQQRRVDSIANAVRSELGPDASDELATALVRLGSLEEPRQSALLRGISQDRVARTYNAVIGALIDALRLVPQDTGDAEGTRQLAALDALLRANEFSALRGMGLIAAAVDPQTGLVLLADASAQAPLFIQQFVTQADAEHSALVVQVELGDDARRVDALADQLARTPAADPPGPAAGPPGAVVADAFAAADSQSTLRRTVQDQVTGQIADAASSRADRARQVALLVGIGAVALLGLVAVLAIAVSRSIANPLRRLTTAATSVADLAHTELTRVTDSETADDEVPHLPPINVTSSDEIGELATAFNRVQSTATMLVERQAVRRNNVSLMFANVAQRTQNLVGRQLALVDDLERNEQDGRLLASLYRLDHLSTRLRRTADNLLVVAGSRGEARISGPIALSTALRSALAEIEDYQRVELDSVDEIMLSAALGSDAVLTFAELLDNATSFSPPDSVVEVGTEFRADGTCLVSIVDHGIGMTAERLTEENGRLVERERLDIAPTSVLGLFVVGRLARRHSLTVRLVETPGGGVTAQVAIPAELYSRRPAPRTPPMPSRSTQSVAPQQRPLPVLPELIIPPASQSEGFSWFPATDQPPPIEPAPEVALPRPSPEPRNRGDLERRVPGSHLAGAPVPARSGSPDGPSTRDAAATRAALDGYQSAIDHAAGTGPMRPVAVDPPIRDGPAGLSRRVPGANLAPPLRTSLPGARAAPAVPPAPVVRDPEAELAAFNAFSAGLDRAGLADESTARARRADVKQNAEPTKGSNA